MPIVTFTPGTCSNVYYDDSCFNISHVRHILFIFTIYYMAPECELNVYLLYFLFGTFVINILSFMTYSVVFAASFLAFSPCNNPSTRDGSSFSSHIYWCYLLRSYWYLNLLPWLSFDCIYLGVSPCHSSVILVCMNFIYASSIFICAHISDISCKYPCIGFLTKIIFHIILNDWFPIVRLFGCIYFKILSHILLVCRKLLTSSIFLLCFLQGYCMLQLSSI